MTKRLTEEQIEKLNDAIDLIHSVKEEVEESGQSKRIWNALDKCEGNLHEVIYKGVSA